MQRRARPTPKHLHPNMRKPSWNPTLAGGLAALAALCACGGEDKTPSALGSDAADLHTVARGEMLITVRENGELKAANQTLIRSGIEGQATLIFLEKEGQVVKKGQKLIELDVSDLREKRATQAISVSRAQAALVAAQQNTEILGKELASNEAESRSKLDIAQIDVEKFLGRAPREDAVPNAERVTNAEMIRRLAEAVGKGQYSELPGKVAQLLVGPDGGDNLSREMGELGQQILEQIDQIRIAQQRLALAKDTKEKSEGLFKDQYITENELKRDQLDFESQTSQVTIAWQKLDILVSYTLRKTKIDLGLKLDNAKLDLEKVVASNEAKRASQLADLSSKEQEYQLADERLKNFDTQIGNAIIYAPTDGLVVAAEVDDRSRDVVQEGSQVRERQSLLTLPDVSRMVAEVKIQESDVDKVRVGQLAVIGLEAFPDQSFTGRVSRVSPVADSGSRWMSSTRKVYKTWVELDTRNEDGSLRPNMTAAVEIRVGTVPDTLAVPVSAVRRVDKHRYVWKATAGGPTAVEVKIGRSTTTQVEITDGLEVGQQVYLAPPPGTTEPKFPDDPADKVAQETPKLPIDPAKDPAVAPAAGPGAGAPAGAAPGEITREAFQAAILAKHPEFKELFDTDRRAMMSQEVRDAIQADPELSEMSAKFMEQMRARFPQGGPGGQGRPGRGQGNGGPGGTGPGSGPGGGNGGRRGRQGNGDGGGGGDPSSGGASRGGPTRDGE